MKLIRFALVVVCFKLTALSAFAVEPVREPKLERNVDTTDTALPLPAVPVEVVNLPTVQTVDGKVQVTGMVSVSNFPTQPSDPTYAVIQVPAIPGELLPNCGPCRPWMSAPFNVAGWKVVSAQLVFTGEGDGAIGAARIAFRNFPDDPFGNFVDLDARFTGPVVGAEAIVQTINISHVFTGLHFSIYLSR